LEKLGRIVEILNSTQLLVQLDKECAESMEAGGTLTVFAKAELSKAASLGLPVIYAPKGTIRIVMQQNDELFLAERFLKGGRVEQRPISAIEGMFTREVKVGGTWSAQIDEGSSLKIEFESELKAGDVVGQI
jgi:hypothetical protein